MSLFQGVGVALVTLFDADGGLAAGATAELAAALVADGVRAVVVAGSTGEAPALDDDERLALVRAVADAVDVPVIAGTGGPSARQAVARTLAAADAGADAALVLSPPRTADPRPYYEQVATAADGLALLAYHYPTASAPGLTVDVVAGLPVVGLKDSSGDASRLLEELTTLDVDVYVGSSALLALAGPCGAAGAILALANSHPRDCALAFAGSVDAQLAIAAAHRRLADFPHGIKALTAEVFGTPMHARMG